MVTQVVTPGLAYDSDELTFPSSCCAAQFRIAPDDGFVR